jgi:hypothetical protein
MGDRVRLTEKVAAAVKKDKEKNLSDNGRMTEGFEYDKSKAKILQRVLHNLNVSLGTLIGAMKELAMLRGSDVTPDGKLGGRGFVMEFRDIKALISDSIRNMSDITDSIGDELTNPKWDLKEKEIKEIKKEKEVVQEEVEEATDVKKEDTEIKDRYINEEDLKDKESNINPNDVKDSDYVQSLKKYKKILEAGKTDDVASILRKRIQANLVN